MKELEDVWDREDQYGKHLLLIIVSYLLVIFLACLGTTLVFAQSASAQSTTAIAHAGMLYLQQDDAALQPALHLETQVAMDVEGMVSRVTVKHRFVNDSPHWQEGVYMFPLPEDSAVNRFRMILSDRVIIGEIHEREEAKQIYEAARAEGKKTALMEQNRPNMFSQRIANIAPGEEMSIELSYVQAVRYDQGRFSLRFPMTITPRYTPAMQGANSELSAPSLELSSNDNGWAMPQTASQPAGEVLAKTPYLPQPLKNPISFDIKLNPGLSAGGINSPSHQIDSQPVSGQPTLYQVRLSEGRVNMDKDFQLHWWPQQGEAPLAALFAEDTNNEAGDTESFVQLMLLPPLALAEEAQQPREITIILDTSGSMAGNSIRQAKQSVQYALSRLKARDSFNLIEFNNTANAVFPAPRPASANNIDAALAFVKRLEANGGTNMAAALNRVLGQNPPAEGRPRLQQVVFITDGSVANEDQLFTLIREKLGDMRLFTVGIGSAPNSFFMRKAAEVGKGSYTYVSSVDTVNDNMNALFSKIENPAVTDVVIDWPSHLKVEQYPAKVPDLYLGEPVFVTARLHEPLTSGAIRVTGKSQGEQWQRRLTIDSQPGQADDYTSSTLASYWGRLKIGSLLDRERMGANKDSIRQEVLNVALPFQLMSPFTSFVAVENIISRPAGKELTSSPVGNEAPEGQLLAAQLAGRNLQPTQLGYASTATGLHWHLLLGLAALLLSILLLLTKVGRALPARLHTGMVGNAHPTK